MVVARTGRTPEKRFRFADTCVEDGCLQWTGSRCGVIEAVLGSDERAAAVAVAPPLPHCVVRSRCRWFAEERGRACTVCRLAVTDTRDEHGPPGTRRWPRPPPGSGRLRAVRAVPAPSRPTP